MAYLWITRWPPYPPLRGGDHDYSRHLIEELASLHRVEALAFRRGDESPPERAGLRWTLLDHRRKARIRSVGSLLPNVAYQFTDRAYLSKALAMAKASDAVFVDFISMFWCVEPLTRELAALGRAAPPVILINHNFESSVRQQMVVAQPLSLQKAALALDAWKAARLERRANRLAGGYAANTEADRAEFQRITAAPSVVITPAYAGVRVAERTISSETPRRICILGNYAAQHKRMVMSSILTELAERRIHEHCEIDVVGDGDSTEFKQRFPQFTFIGYVEDLTEYLGQIRFGLMPDEIGGGFKHRALTHAFHRVPMLAVHHALNGMGFEPGLHYLGVDTIQQMTAAIPEILNDTAVLNRVQTACYDHCTTRYDWTDRGRDLRAFAERLRLAGAA